jgi:DNA-binding NarL/FixJ family response regulator
MDNAEPANQPSKRKQPLILLEASHLLCIGVRDWLKDEENYPIQHHVTSWKAFTALPDLTGQVIILTSFNWIINNPGISEFSEFMSAHPALRVICFNDDGQNIWSNKILGNCISGVINLTAVKEDFIWGLKHVSEGMFYISTTKPVDSWSFPPNSGVTDPETNLILTKREAEVLNLISHGFSDKEIAELLHLSKRTVNGYRDNLLIKFGARNSPQLVRIAIEKNRLLLEEKINPKNYPDTF